MYNNLHAIFISMAISFIDCKTHKISFDDCFISKISVNEDTEREKVSGKMAILNNSGERKINS
jgi:hypothetical protein